MNKRVSVMIMGNDPDILGKLESDLTVLGFDPIRGTYPEPDIEEILRLAPEILIMDLTVNSNSDREACDLLLRQGMLPEEILPVALVSEDTMGRIPMEFKFNEVVRHPYDIHELGFRLRRVEHHLQQEPRDDTIHVGNLTISPSRYMVTADGQPVVFSYKEYQLFKYLVTHPNRVFTRENLLNNIWGENLVNGIRTIDVHIRRVRAKIGDIENKYIKTVRGVGYTFRYDG